MRKLIAITLLMGGMALGAALNYPSPAYVLDAAQLEYVAELPPRLLEDLSYAQNGEETHLTVILSHQEFFYDESVSVSILASNPEAGIYYTLDSSTPTIYSEVYTEPLEFVAGKETECIVLKAVAIDGNEESAVVTHSYFVGETVYERFQTDYVFSLSTDADNLYGYEEGILVEGKAFADYVAANPDWETDKQKVAKNWERRGRDWERPVHVEVFTSLGKQVINQNAGIRVFGGVSRSSPQKSLRLFARREYEPKAGMFHYPFFVNHTTTEKYPKPLLSYDTLDLRNDGNDWIGARLRTPLASWIAAEAGYDAVTPYAATAVFLNGEYYGYAVLNAKVDDESYLQELCNAPKRSFEIVDEGHIEIETKNEDSRNEWSQMMELVGQGLTDSTTQALGLFVDIDNFLFYHALQTYIANRDWMPNNMKMWRYSGDPTKAEYLATGLDGRWRYVIFDLDNTLDCDNISTPSIRNLLEREASPSPIFVALLQHPLYAEKFSNYICDLAYEHFAIQNVERVIGEINKASLHEIRQAIPLYEDILQSTRRIQTPPAGDIESVFAYRAEVTDFIAQRPAYVLAELCDLFGYTDIYRVTSDGTAKINTLNGNEGQYFRENSVPVTPILARGQAFDYWLVNGERRDGEDLRVSFADADANGVVHVECVARDALPPLFFLATYDSGDICGFTMYNPTDITQSTCGLYLSDDINNLKKWPFPYLNVRPGAVWEFVGQNSTSYDSLLKIGLNFNPIYGEAVFLSNENGEVLDWLAVTP
ncbi:MAG: CotH kinase family protein [Lachnospiraceae bacterium]|jgi:hypothetical protein|nr:CotH kinase family protein [Lachnospiraceae bacterium]